MDFGWKKDVFNLYVKFEGYGFSQETRVLKYRSVISNLKISLIVSDKTTTWVSNGVETKSVVLYEIRCSRSQTTDKFNFPN